MPTIDWKAECHNNFIDLQSIQRQIASVMLTDTLEGKKKAQKELHQVQRCIQSTLEDLGAKLGIAIATPNRAFQKQKGDKM